VTGEAPRLRTAVRVGFRDGALLVRFDGRDEGTVATLRRRDEPLWTEDVYEVFVTPLEPPTVYFEFEINPLGTLFDARVTSPELARVSMNVDVGWNLPGLRGRSRVRPRRWSATLTIPIAPMLEVLPPLPPRGSARGLPSPTECAGRDRRSRFSQSERPAGRGEGVSSRCGNPWRANFFRIDRGTADEFSAWSPAGREPPDFHEASRFGRLTLPG
jgi:hypothetical protein